ncbi:Type IV fimbrial biogenesis protein PilX [Lysobacter dokdonensis DS-58]|uniref:Type IV fimbrial biogenesis protein PilX n=1 Tax=Lysobacter dokdonensis DS-58 TaxID=1300345 RepID=A0A0A2WP15_9GAMM|nr:PilX N-terminal domain-containing pilus assembly protein [Lysobacter dokdonensis]KGQ20482.1 Type IV fimbrial biogenesis protein PilX [Lysobacter dokdonensis DS-58]
MTNFHPRGQRGIALIVVLILLVVMSLLAIVSLRSTLLEERMSANMMDRSLSFQAAEAALREGEAIAAGKSVGDAACTNGICNQPAAASAPRWQGTGWTNARTTSVNLGNKTAAAQYFIEYLANNVPARGTCTTTEDVSPDATCTQLEWRYRITARSTAAGRATVMLQTTYAVP